MGNWLEREKSELLRKVARFDQFASAPTGIDAITLETPERLAGQYDLSKYWQAIAAFPEPAQTRILSALRTVRGEHPHYFHASSANGRLQLTTESDEALSQTHVVPSSYSMEWGWPHSAYTVTLYRLPEYFTDRWVGKLIHLHGLVHELAHVLVGASWSQESYEPAIAEFAHLMAEHQLPPISHYSAGYWSEAAELMPSQKEDGAYGLMPKALDEELAEVLAAWILKFCFCEPYVILTNGGRQRIELRSRGSLGFRPFADRPAIEEWATNFLYAE